MNKIMSRFNLNKLLSIMTMVCILLCFFVYFFNIISGDFFGAAGSNPIIRYVQFPLSLIALGIALFNKKIFRYFDIKMMLLFFVWFCISIIANRNEEAVRFHVDYVIAFASVLIPCSILPYVLEKEKMMKYLKAISGIYILIMLVFAIVGLTCAIQGITINSLAIGIKFDGRLEIMGTPNMVAIEMMIGIGLVLLFVCKKSRILVYVGAGLIIALFSAVIVFTDCRSVKFAVLPIFFLYVFLKTRTYVKKENSWKYFLLPILLGFVACGMFFAYCSFLFKVNSKLEIIGIPDSVAEEALKYGITGVSGRSITEGVKSNFGNRLPMWKYAIENIFNDMRHLIFGATPAMSHDMFLLKSYEWEHYAHFHNAYIAILTSFGLPGLLFFVIYCVGFIKSTIQMIFSKDKKFSLEEQFIPATAISILIIFIVEECILTLGYYTPEGIWLVILFAYTYCIARKESKNEIIRQK